MSTTCASQALAARMPKKALIMNMDRVQAKIVLVTPEMAADWLETAIYERQRKRAQWQVNRLAKEIANGTMIEGTQIHFCVLGGKLKLVNGQHTLAAIVKTGKPFPLSVLMTVVENEVEPGQIYGRHDVHRTRTPHDAFLALDLADKLKLQQPEVNAFAVGLKYILNDFRRLSVNLDPEVSASRDFIANAMMEWSPIAGLYFDPVRNARLGLKGPLKRGAVVAIGLATLKYQPSSAQAFWMGAANDDKLKAQDPRRALNNFLTSKSSSSGDPLTYMRTVASAWNAFFQGRKMQTLRPIDIGKIGITLLGTPYKAVPRTAGHAASSDEAAPARRRQTGSAQIEARL